ncbi:hypothetical protein [Leifsonia aquatica]|uniref:hypothetical protein n=1 Tax=Leifsonia aquatica TaxID=144185 RepID=UPI00046AE0B6|nr:hypothetical protein [Leifsonia aquatica]
MGAQVYASIPGTQEIWDFTKAVKPGEAAMNHGRAGVVLSGTPGSTKSVQLVGGLTISGIRQPDNGQGALRSTVETTGTFDFAVVGATGTEKTGVPVYFVVADETLTLTKVDDATTPGFGVVNLPEGFRYRGVLPVKIGVVVK